MNVMDTRILPNDLIAIFLQEAESCHWDQSSQTGRGGHEHIIWCKETIEEEW
jgi:hypothetical protein